MPEKDSELRVVRQSRDGRRRYDEAGKRALIEAALQPGVSVARLAQRNGIYANLLRKWIAKFLLVRGNAASLARQDDGVIESEPPRSIEMTGSLVETPHSPAQGDSVNAAQPAFVPVVSASPAVLALAPPCVASSTAAALHVRLPNGIEFDLGEASREELTTIVQMLGKMPC